MTKDPRFHTTSIAASRTANEIGDLVAAYGARSFSVTFDAERNPVALHFVMEVPDVGEVPVELRPQIDALAKRLYKKPRYEWVTEEVARATAQARGQAMRVGWRQIKAYVEMMLEMVENGLKPFHEAFMSDVMLQVGAGQYLRLGDAYREAHGRLALPAATTVVDAEFEEVE